MIRDTHVREPRHVPRPDGAVVGRQSVELLAAEMESLARTLRAEAGLLRSTLDRERAPTCRELRGMSMRLDDLMGVVRETTDALTLATEKAEHRQTMLP